MDPAAYVQSLADQVIAVLADETLSPDDARRQLGGLFMAAFDVETVGKFVLGRHWRALTPAQRQDYMVVFPAYIADIYARQFAAYSGQTFTVMGQTVLDETNYLVDAVFRDSSGAPITANFRLRGYGDHLKILDAKVEGVSLVLAKREEFTSFLDRNSFEKLVAHLRRQVETRAKPDTT